MSTKPLTLFVLGLPAWPLPVVAVALLTGADSVFTQQGLFFSGSALVTFGGAYAVLAYVAQQAVQTYAWVTPGEMTRGLALAETTPGPLIMVVQFVAFLGAYRNPGDLDPWAAALLGALLTTWVTFVPSFLFIFLGAPYVERLRGNRTLSAALTAITAAVVGVIANLALYFTTHTLFADSTTWTTGPLRCGQWVRCKVLGMVTPKAGRDVVVVGAGIVGTSIAYHAAQAGALVTLLEAGRAGEGVTVDSFAWIGSSGVSTGAAAGLRLAATDEYRRLEAELPGLPVTWSGSLTWAAGESAPEPGLGQEIVDGATVVEREPNVRRPPRWAVWAPGDGAVDPVGVAERLVAGARDHGARVHLGSPVFSVRQDAVGCVVGVETAAGFHPAATVVLAAGTATPALAAPLGVRVPVDASPSTLMRLRAPAGLVRGVVSTQDFDLRQVSADRLIAAADSPERAVAAVRSIFRGGSSVGLIGGRVGARPVPADGDPIIGQAAEVPGLYLAVMHRAVNLAAIVGRLAARELVDDAVEPALASCRPDRFERSGPGRIDAASRLGGTGVSR